MQQERLDVSFARLEMCVEARLLDLESRIGHRAAQESMSMAFNVGWLYPDMGLPTMFWPHPFLMSSWHDGKEAIEAAQALALQAENLAAGNWDALGVPSPQVLLAQLMAGEYVKVLGNGVSFDSANGLVWGTNSYGCDFVVCVTPPREGDIEVFVRELISGQEFGPVPY